MMELCIFGSLRYCRKSGRIYKIAAALNLLNGKRKGADEYNYVFCSDTHKKMAAGHYELERLDRKECDNCKVRLYDDYIYDILVKDKIVGHSKWHTETAIDIPGSFLKTDNGPNYVVWEHDRFIEYIDRTQDK